MPPGPGDMAGDPQIAPPLPGIGPYANVDSHLRALAGAAEGFSHAAIGGLEGEIYHVTSLGGTYIPI